MVAPAALAGLPTSTTVVSSANPSAQGQTVTFTATVFAASGTPTGAVVFMDGTATIGSALLVDRRATYATSMLAVGSHSITAVYQGDGAYDGSYSPPVTQVVLAGPGTPTTTTLSSVPNPSTAGQIVTFTATVNCPGGAPSGTVQFFRNGVYLSISPLAGGVAVMQTTDLAEGSHSMTAAFSGGDGCAASTSAALLQVVNAAPKTPTSVNLTASPNPSVAGDPVTFTATVSSSQGPPPGTVNFTDGGVQFGTATLSNGKAALTTSSLSAGTHLIRAVYPGNSAFSASNSPNLSQTVRSADTRPVLTSSANPSVFAQPVVFQVQLDASCTGTVAFMDGQAWQASVPIAAGGLAQWTANALSVATHEIVAVYAGGALCPTSSAATLAQVVQPAATITTLTASAAGDSIAFTATVQTVAPGGGTPSGPVVFRDAEAILATVALNAQGSASATVAMNPAGEHAVTAEYQGSGNHAASASLVLSDLTNLDKPSFEGAHVVNSASYAAGLAPGAYSTVFGLRLAAGATALASIPYPTSLSGVQVAVNGAPVQVVYVSDQQINFLAPLATAPGTAGVVVTSPAGSSREAAVSVYAALPGIFYDAVSGYGAILIAGTADTTLTRPAAAGEWFEIYCTGLGAVDSTNRTVLPVAVTLGGVRLTPAYSGLNSVYPGLYQVNVQIPPGLTGEQTLTLEIDGRTSNAVKVRLQ